MKLRPLWLLPVTLLAAAPASAAVTRIEIAERGPYENSRPFGAVGPYERLLGRVHFAVDPKLKANTAVVDLDKAPRNGAGQVEFSADLEILAPKDLSHANGTLLYDVNNRGGKVSLGMFNGGADGFLMRQGYIIVSSGWIAELLPGGGRLRLDAPIATDNGKPITGLVRAEMVPDAPAERLNIAHWANHGSYPPTERGLREATLTWRQREADPRISIPRAQWRLEQKPVPGSRLPSLELVLTGGFRPGYLYELVYEAEGPLVQGLGLAGIRDLVSHLKHASAGNPLLRADGRPAPVRAIGFGVSQSGRLLRQLLYDGFNADEQGRIVFEGLFPHVPGAGMGYFNHRFASPTRHAAQHENHLYPVDVFPFTYGDAKDPFTGRTDGLLRRARASRTVPKVFHVNTGSEYWHRAASLAHTDPAGKRDAVIPPEVRIYTLGGCQHGPGSGVPGGHGSGWLPGNPSDYRPLLRGLLTALNDWVRDGTTPPPSRYPRITDGTLVGWRQAESGWKALPGVRYPEVINEPRWRDFGPHWLTERRITLQPPAVRGHYTVLVPAHGPDNNELGTLLLPSVAVPVATHTGWNLRHPTAGADGELLSLAGSYIQFARTPEDRQRTGDPRPALLERYPSFDRYLDEFTKAAHRLISERYLPEEDLPGLLDLARRQRPLFEAAPQ